MYLCGLMLNGERKSIQPMTERLPEGNDQALQQFVNQSPWFHEPIQVALIKYLLRHLPHKKEVLIFFFLD